MEHLTFHQLSAYHIFIIIGNDLMNDRMIDTLGLQYHPSAFVLTSGTQMVSKGLDFDHVSIVGILNADTMLNYPDFRSYERVFQLMAQVSVRAGRKNKVCNNLLISRAGTCSIQVHPGYGSFREKDFDVVFNLFRTETTVHQFCTLAGRTGFRQLIRIIAVVTG